MITVIINAILSSQNSISAVLSKIIVWAKKSQRQICDIIALIMFAKCNAMKQVSEDCPWREHFAFIDDRYNCYLIKSQQIFEWTYKKCFVSSIEAQKKTLFCVDIFFVYGQSVFKHLLDNSSKHRRPKRKTDNP